MNHETAFSAYQQNFPSKMFLDKHFGATTIVTGNPNRGEIDLDLFDGLRKLFDGVLRLAPAHLLRLPEYNGRVDIFVDRQPAPWVDHALEQRGLMKELPPEAFQELCTEFITHCRAGVFQKTDWWEWHTESNSIWIACIPGTSRPRRTLAGILGIST